MMRFSSIILFFSIVFLSCTGKKKNTEQVSKALCECFSNYDSTRAVSMNKVIACNDSIMEEGTIYRISKEKIQKRLAQDCPEVLQIIKSLSQD